MNSRPITLPELKEGLVCQIIDKRASFEQLQAVDEIKKHFKRDYIPNLVYKDHVLTASDVEYYTNNPELIKRDILIILTDL